MLADLIDSLRANKSERPYAVAGTYGALSVFAMSVAPC